MTLFARTSIHRGIWITTLTCSSYLLIFSLKCTWSCWRIRATASSEGCSCLPLTCGNTTGARGICAREDTIVASTSLGDSRTICCLCCRICYDALPLRYPSTPWKPTTKRSTIISAHTTCSLSIRLCTIVIITIYTLIKSSSWKWGISYVAICRYCKKRCVYGRI